MNDADISSDPELQKLIERFPRLFRGAQPAVWSHVPVCGALGEMRKLGGWATVRCACKPGGRMKIQLASDLHLEFLGRWTQQVRMIEPAPDADLLVLAGDIHRGTQAVEVFADWPVPVLYLAGNHEFYGHSFEETRADLRRACAGTNVKFLDNDVLKFDGVRVMGCTLWTDFRLSGATQARHMREVERGLNDYRLIRTQAGTMRAEDTLADHERSRDWLERELAKPFGGKTVVVTHHGPNPLSIAPRFVGNALNAGFVSDLTPLMAGVDLWLHGHVHDSFDYRVGGCRVVANPAGYVLNGTVEESHAWFELENGEFDPMLVLVVVRATASG